MNKMSYVRNLFKRLLQYIMQAIYIFAHIFGLSSDQCNCARQFFYSLSLIDFNKFHQIQTPKVKELEPSEQLGKSFYNTSSFILTGTGEAMLVFSANAQMRSVCICPQLNKTLQVAFHQYVWELSYTMRGHSFRHITGRSQKRKNTSLS